MTTPLTIPFFDPADDSPDLPEYVGIPERAPRAELATIEHLPRVAAPPHEQASASATAPDPGPAGEIEQGLTRRVEQLLDQVAEVRLLADLRADQTPLLLDSPKVRRRQRAAYEAARLHALAQDPAMRAWSAARMRRLLMAGAMVALAWSTAVRDFRRHVADAACRDVRENRHHLWILPTGGAGGSSGARSPSVQSIMNRAGASARICR